jgi:hypothetical protein
VKPKVIVVREKEVKERVVYRDRPTPAGKPYEPSFWDTLLIHYAGICSVCIVPALVLALLLWAIGGFKR